MYMFNLLLLICSTTGHVYVKNKAGNETIYGFRSEAASFNPDDVFELTGLLFMSEPASACSPIKNSSQSTLDITLPNCSSGQSNGATNYILLVRRGNCTVATQMENARIAGFEAIIVFSDKEEMEANGQSMQVEEDVRSGPKMLLPTVFMEYRNGRFLQTDFLFTSGHCVSVTFPDETALKQFLSTFLLACLGVLCFFGVLFFVVDCVEKTESSKIPRSALKKMKMSKFDETDAAWPDHECSICYTQYKNNENLRILPCQHRFHSGCVDPWLVKNAGICPLCRQNVLEQPLIRSANSAVGLSDILIIGQDNTNSNQLLADMHINEMNEMPLS